MPKALTAACVLSVLVISACASDAEPDPYAARVAEAQTSASSEFERTVLADGVVDRAEYEEAMNLFAACMAAAGVDVSLADQRGYFVYQVTDESAFDAEAPACREGRNGLIESLYVDILTNPQALDPDEALVQCLIRHEVVPAAFTTDDFAEVMSHPAGVGNLPSSHEWASHNLDPSTNPLVDACFANPNS